MAAHNAKTFDAHRLVRWVYSNGLYDQYADIVSGFADTLPFFKTLYRLPNYKLPTVVSHVLGSAAFTQHDAMEDSKILQQVCQQLSESSLHTYSFSIQAALHGVKRHEACDANLSSLTPLVKDKLISMATATRIASSGLRLTDIQLAHKRSGADGVKHLMQEKDSNGRVRVTNSAATLKKLMLFFAK